MIRKFYFSVALLATLPLAAVAGTNSIGTASARGDMRVDNYQVQGNATLFNGSVVQTGVASVDVRMPAGVQIMLAAESQGTLYRDHLVLQSGASSLTSSSSYSLEAKGLRVTPNAPNTHGVVSLRSGGNVDVAALSGSFGVTNQQGVFLGNVIPGKALRFAAAAAGAPDASVSITGTISKTGDNYFVTDSTTGKIYQLTGKGFRKYAGTGKTVTVTSAVSSETPLAGSGAVEVLSNPTVALVAAGAGTAAGTTGGLLTGLAIGAAAGTAVAAPIIISTSKSGTPGSL